MAHDLTPAAKQRFAQLEGSDASKPVAAWLRRIATEGSEFDGFKINAFRVARDLGVSRLDAVRTFLIATRLGITDLSWDMRCPACSGFVGVNGLADLPMERTCTACGHHGGVDFDDMVEATFTFNPDVRPVRLGTYQGLPDLVEFVRELERREGRSVALELMVPGSEKTLDLGDLPPGEYGIENPGAPDKAAHLHVAGERASTEQSFSVVVRKTGEVTPLTLSARPGRVKLVVRTELDGPWPVRVRAVGPRTHWVSATYVTALQDFRDLFSSEYLAPGVTFAIKSTTLMFTDIKGSTELYEQLGDAKAYALVQEHFRLMTDAIRQFEGGIVKTIGDAVMAAFPVNKNAVAAALEIQRAFARASPGPGLIEVKLGLHRGPTIAVTSNRALDYFGRTVNIAARVQGQSGPREVLMTDAVANDPAVRELLAAQGLKTRTFDAALKGISARIPVHATQP